MSKEVINSVLKYSSADQTEVIYNAENSALTRFANNYIHQNVAENNAGVQVRVVLGKKTGSASTNRLDEDSIKKTVDKAIEIASVQPENPLFVSLPSPSAFKIVDSYFSRTANYSPKDRAEAASIIFGKAQASDVVASGALSTSETELVIANSLGVWAEQKMTRAEFNLVVTGKDDASGYSYCLTRNVDDMDFAALADEAIYKCRNSYEPMSVEPDDFAVILEPYAVGTLLEFLGYLGFGALALQEGRSFMCGKIGQKITDEKITIWDDGNDTLSLSLPFDFEGVPKKKVMLIENGIAKGVVYDSFTANIDSTHSTGHALPAPNSDGPFALNLLMKAGESSVEEMIASTKRGIYVTRFHYTNVIEPMSTTITGLTRDGTFLIENGKIKNAVKNLRFTNSVLDALSNVSLISKDTKLVEGFFGGNRVPALKIDKFTFSGKTEE